MARPNVLASLSLALLAATPASALDWPQFRGAHRDGVSAETGLARAWSPEGPRVVWRRPIGEGYSSISAVGDRLYTMDSDDTTEYVLALEAASGKELWRVPAGPKLNDSMGNGPRTTPTVDGDTVYAMGSHGLLLALKAADGAKLWVYTPQLKQVNVAAAPEALAGPAGSFLQGLGQVREQFEVRFLNPAQPTAADGLTVLDLTPKQPQPLLARLVLSVDPKTGLVRKAVIYDESGNTVTVRFLDVAVNPGLPDTLFVFTPPPGVAVIQN